MLANLIAKEAKVSHFDSNVVVGKASKLKEKMKAEIREAYGESYLNDADYVIFVYGKEVDGSKSSKESLFKLVDRALGETANLLSKSDFDVIREKAEDDEAEGAVKYMFVKVTLN